MKISPEIKRQLRRLYTGYKRYIPHLTYQQVESLYKLNYAQFPLRAISKTIEDLRTMAGIEEKPEFFNCPICGKKFGYKVSLHIHMGLKHGRKSWREYYW